MHSKHVSPANPLANNIYLAQPTTGTGQGVLVLPAWWGLNPFFKKMCDRLAKAGFVALAPDLYHGLTASTIEEAEKLSSQLIEETVAQEVTQAADQLRALCSPKQTIGVIGFSLGGSWALWLAERKSSPIAATVVFYATRPGDYTQSQSAFQFHMAETDAYEEPLDVKRLQTAMLTAGRQAEFYTYPGTTHWFFEADRPDAYQARAAELAWDRTVQFLKQHITHSE